jgi:hypothetical protein
MHHQRPICRQQKKEVSHAKFVNGCTMDLNARRITHALHAATLFVPSLKRIVFNVGSTDADIANYAWTIMKATSELKKTTAQSMSRVYQLARTRIWQVPTPMNMLKC